MTKSLLGSLITLSLLTISAVPGFAHEQQHQGADMMKHQKSEMRHMKMMDNQGMADKLDKKTCMLTGKMSMKQGGMKHGGMHGMMKKDFYLDRIAELGLSKDQIRQLQEIHSACRRDNLRAATEVKIARFDLKDLLDGDWTLKSAEELIRKIATLEGDIKVRHLTAAKAALDVLSKEQRAQLSADESPESLFEN